MAESSFEDILNSITSSPDLLNKISKSVKENEGGDISRTIGDVISLIQESQDNTSGEKAQESNANEAEKEIDNEAGDKHAAQAFKQADEKSGAKLDGLILSLGKSMSKTSPLLLALKPYLSKSRCDLIDNLINMSRLASIVNLAK